jgi:ABC-type branched-subunit amino acid transport system substrate-binding protein
MLRLSQGMLSLLREWFVSKWTRWRLIPTKKRRWIIWNIVLVVMVAFLSIYEAISVWHSTFPSIPSLVIETQDPCQKQLPFHDRGIGVMQLHGSSEYIGISDGRFSFDTSRPDANLKCQGSQKLGESDNGGAESFWTQAIQRFQTGSNQGEESNDAEALIYREDQYVLNSCRHPSCAYITFIIGTILSGDYVSVGRDTLQGVYVAQEEYNRSHNSIKVRLLIANYSSMGRTNSQVGQQIANLLAGQIVKAAVLGKYQSIIGVMGLPYISENAIQILKEKNIPIVLPTGSSESQTNRATNVFSVAASTEREGKVGALYVERKLNKKNVAVFVDRDNPYSRSLASAFESQFTMDGNSDTIVVEETYTVGDTESIKKNLQDIQSNHYQIDLIYFAGDARDANAMLENLPLFTNLPANLRVMGGDELYELGGYTDGNYRRLDFTVFAFADEWVDLAQPQHPFSSEYRLLFAGWPPDRVYGYSRPDNDTILSFDSMLTLLLAYERVSQNQPSLLNALQSINDMNPVQGFSGRISFGPNGNPINKAVVVLHVDKNGFTQLANLDGCLLVNLCRTI